MLYFGSNICSKFNLTSFFGNPLSYTQIRNYAARKGYREKKQKNRVKKVVEKVGFIPHNLRNKQKMLAARPKRKFDESKLGLPTDNVYIMKYYKWIIYPFIEAVRCHKETHHPTMYNKPNEKLQVSIELNMEGEKKTRFLDNFTRVVLIPHKFDHEEERNILVFSKNENELQIAKKRGALLTGGIDLIKQIQNGAASIQEFHYILANPNILPELVQLRGLMKKKFPNPKNGTLGIDINEMIERHINGINYTAKKDEYEKDFGLIETVIGTLDMDEKHLEENFSALINDVYKMKPKRPGEFISRCLLSSPPSPEILKINHEVYLIDKSNENNNEDNKKEEEIDEEEKVERIIL